MVARIEQDEAATDIHAERAKHLANAPIASPRVVTSDTLLRGDSQLAILHERTVYFLRRTRFGKLILTK
ncbi:MAG TPA: hemin uptake protein HemP [Casimicrobiaceae bacterium]|jgi:hemin uptake protein HemP